jgi:hypothetical protein
VAQYAQLGQPQTVKVFGIMRVIFAGFGLLGAVWSIFVIVVGNLFFYFIPQTPEIAAQAKNARGDGAKHDADDPSRRPAHAEGGCPASQEMPQRLAVVEPICMGLARQQGGELRFGFRLHDAGNERDDGIRGWKFAAFTAINCCAWEFIRAEIIPL